MHIEKFESFYTIRAYIILQNVFNFSMNTDDDAANCTYKRSGLYKRTIENDIISLSTTRSRLRKFESVLPTVRF